MEENQWKDTTVTALCNTVNMEWNETERGLEINSMENGIKEKVAT